MNIKIINLKYMNRMFLSLGLLLMLAAIPLESFAAETDAISQTLCNVIAKLTGPIGKGIATISIIVLGIGMFLGKLSWPVAVATALGIGMIFGAANIVSFVGTGSNVTTTGAGASTGAGGVACSGS